jgi:hypothetical protein
MGRLGKRPEPSQALTELLALKLDFSSHALFLFGRYAKFPCLVEGLLDGFRLAGLKI